MIVELSEVEVFAVVLELDGIASVLVMVGESDFVLEIGHALFELDDPVAAETYAIVVEFLVVGILVATAFDFD